MIVIKQFFFWKCLVALGNQSYEFVALDMKRHSRENHQFSKAETTFISTNFCWECGRCVALKDVYIVKPKSSDKTKKKLE